MEFKEWIDSARKDLDKAVDQDVHNNSIFQSNKHKSMLFPYYREFKIFQETQKLVWATWGLAIATIILSGLTIYFQNFK